VEQGRARTPRAGGNCGFSANHGMAFTEAELNLMDVMGDIVQPTLHFIYESEQRCYISTPQVYFGCKYHTTYHYIQEAKDIKQAMEMKVDSGHLTANDLGVEVGGGDGGDDTAGIDDDFDANDIFAVDCGDNDDIDQVEAAAGIVAIGTDVAPDWELNNLPQQEVARECHAGPA